MNSSALLKIATAIVFLGAIGFSLWSHKIELLIWQSIGFIWFLMCVTAEKYHNGLLQELEGLRKVVESKFANIIKGNATLSDKKKEEDSI